MSAGYTFSSIAKQPGFPEGKLPMPMIVATSRDYDQIIVSRNTTVFEFNPFEMGSWDPQLWGMAPMKFVGSRFERGVVSGACTRGFDNLGFVMGTSSSLFNEFAVALAQNDSTGIFAGLLSKLRDLAIDISHKNNDIANWTPNPFYQWNEEKNRGDASHTLTLADGGEDYQNIP
jgi:lysophospholipase